MADKTNNIAGDYPVPIKKITCILNEGTPTIGTSYDQTGASQQTLTWANELKEGAIVAVANDTDVTFDTCGGAICVEAPTTAEQLIIGQIKGLPTLNRFPVSSGLADTLAKRLAGGYYRLANVEIWGGITKITKADVTCDGTNATVPGIGTTLKMNMARSAAQSKLCLLACASGGAGVIPFHYVAPGTAGDVYSCLVGINDKIASITGV